MLPLNIYNIWQEVNRGCCSLAQAIHIALLMPLGVSHCNLRCHPKLTANAQQSIQETQYKVCCLPFRCPYSGSIPCN